jgi:tripeptidyl-peptidase-1
LISIRILEGHSIHWSCVLTDGIDEVGNSNASQCVFGTHNQYFSPTDLTKFQQQYGLPVQAVYDSIGGHESSAVCDATAESCTEGNLDVQYIMAVGQNVPTMFYYDNSTSEFVLHYMVGVLSMPNSSRPLVHSISYGAMEHTMDGSIMQSFETVMKRLSALGVTVLAGSGDDGVGGLIVKSNHSLCGYYAVWPSTSPYVISVGATQGPESDMDEVACSSNTNGTITSGGGFSDVYGRPSWQHEAVSGYFDTVAGTSAEPVAGYNTSGRAYPDVSVMGYNYEVIVGGSGYLISGTVRLA